MGQECEAGHIFFKWSVFIYMIKQFARAPQIVGKKKLKRLSLFHLFNYASPKYLPIPLKINCTLMAKAINPIRRVITLSPVWPIYLADMGASLSRPYVAATTSKMEMPLIR